VRLAALAASALGLIAAVAVPGAGGAEQRAPYRLVAVARGLHEPVHVAVPRSQPRNLYVVERRGRIRVQVAGRLRARPFLDLRGRVSTNTEQGLLSIAFHPRYGRNRRFFVYYTERSGDIRVVEYRSRGLVALPGTARTIFSAKHPAPNHNGGQLLFGPDGYLYLGTGDGGGRGDPDNNAQDLSSPLGKLLRIAVDRRGTPVETVAYGLRNPWRFSFDRANGDLYIGDVGQDSFEEIDYTPRRSPGLENYGWRVHEGNSRFTDEEPNPAGKLVFPVRVYGRTGGASVTGGFVYRGREAPAAVGRYFFGDFASGRVWSFRISRSRAVGFRRERLSVPGLSSFGEGPRGELYLVSFGGVVWRLAG
jgi:glucose/arabinose dehydrogenase